MYFHYESHPFRVPPEMSGRRRRHAVAILGGGPTGLTLALGLARRGVHSVVLEADDTVCQGSRATCISRRSLEIFRQFGVGEAFARKGLGWTGGRSFYRSDQVLAFSMPSDALEQHPPMTNLQQCFTEQFILDGVSACPEVDLRWRSRAIAVAPDERGAVVRVATPEGEYDLEADWVVACDGARSVAREAFGLRLEGTSYEGRYVIVDIRLASRHPVVERRVWFDPPTNPGSTVIMHRQPDDIWRIDYQLREGEDPDEEVKPERVVPRVRRHLEWIGETADWDVEWISIYRAHALTLDSYRRGRVLFAGEAAHLLPIFGVRGLNSCVDDAHNLAWKLAGVVRGRSREALLDSYSGERVAAARENIAQATKSTWFMTPPSRGYALMRDAALSLAVSEPFARALVNPRQTTPIAYVGTPLSWETDGAARPASGPEPGAPFVNLPGRARRGDTFERVHLLDALGPDFSLLAFFERDEPDLLDEIGRMADAGPAPCRVIAIVAGGSGARTSEPERVALADAEDCLFRAYGASHGTAYLLRPDNYVAARWLDLSDPRVRGSVAAAIRRAACTA